MMNDFPCLCGHIENVHPPYPHTLGVGHYIVCDGCFKNNRVKGVKQFETVECTQYVPSNLKYLEQLYEAKHK